MEQINLSIESLITCLVVLTDKRDELQKRIYCYSDSKDVPTWMFDRVNEYEDALSELQSSLKNIYSKFK